MSYDINAIKKKIAALAEQNARRDASRSKGQREKLTYFKPKMGSQEVRFLPYDDGSGQPFQQIDYYDCKALTPRRICTPSQWSLPDPVADLIEELQKDRSNDATWNILKQLRVKESNYALVYVRGQEDKGVQVWELNQTVLNQVYSVLAHPDYATDDMFDPKDGFDFTITCSDSGKTIEFNDNVYKVKNYDVQPRRKPSPLAKTKAERDEIIASMPDLNAFHKQFVMSEEKLTEAVTNFLSQGTGSPHTEEAVEAKSDPTAEETAASSKIDDAFKDL